MDIRISEDALDALGCDLLAVGIPDGADIEGSLAGFPAGLAKGVAGMAADEEFTGKGGSIALFPTLGLLKAPRLALVGTGKGAPDDVRQASRAVGDEARRRGVAAVALRFGSLDGTQTLAAIEGFGSGNYRFDGYKREADRKRAATSLILHGGADQSAFAQARAVLAGQELARDLVNQPAAVMYPATLAEAAQALAGDGVTVEVWDEARIRDERMGGITAVGQGSVNPPRFVHLRYKPPGKAARTVAIVGKGVTFDSGGLSLKPSDGMQTMRCDMSGAASVLGVFKALKALKPEVEVHGVIGAVENMNSGSAYKLGDILTMRNGKTVEVHNTDAEGRLVLADCLSYICERKPDAIVDLATLTGACVIALGEHYSGLFASDDKLAGELSAAAEGAGEGLWRMPMPAIYREMLKADWADMKNVGGRAAGAITAALFLKEFVDESIPWAHCDIAGPAFFDKPTRHFAAGGTGALVPTLVRWIAG